MKTSIGWMRSRLFFLFLGLITLGGPGWATENTATEERPPEAPTGVVGPTQPISSNEFVGPIQPAPTPEFVGPMQPSPSEPPATDSAPVEPAGSESTASGDPSHEAMIDALSAAVDVGVKITQAKDVDPVSIREKITWALQKASEYGFSLKGISIGRYKVMALGVRRQTGRELVIFPDADPEKKNTWHFRRYRLRSWGGGLRVEVNAGFNIGLIFDWADPSDYEGRFCEADISGSTIVGVGAALKLTCTKDDFASLKDAIVERVKSARIRIPSAEPPASSEVAAEVESQVLEVAASASKETGKKRVKGFVLHLGVGAGGGFSVSSPVHAKVGKDKVLRLDHLEFVKQVVLEIMADELDLDESELQ